MKVMVAGFALLPRRHDMGKSGFFVALGLIALMSCATPPKGPPPPDPRIGELQGQVDSLQGSIAERDAAIGQLQGQVADLRNQGAAMEVTIAQLKAGNTEVANLQNAAAAKDATIGQLQAQVADLQQQLATRNATLGQLQDQKKASDDRVTATSARASQLEAELNALRKTVAVRDSELGALNAKLAALGKTNDELSANLASMRSGSTRSQADFLAQIAAINKEKAGLLDRVSALEKERDALAILAAADEKDLEARVAQLKTTFAAEIARGELDVKRYRNVLSVSVSDRILFDPDSPKLRAASLPILAQLAAVFKNAPDKVVRVEGNTAVAVSSPESLKLYPTSWHLGAARAANVVQYLQEKCGMDPLQLVATSLGEYRPKSDNSSEAEMAKNRRVEFVLIARDLYEIERLQSMTK
jgi:chemotaxis protein MotB